MVDVFSVTVMSYAIVLFVLTKLLSHILYGLV